MNYLARQKNLAADLRNSGLDALLVTHLPNVRYLCGFTGTAGVLLVQAGARSHKLTFYTDGRYTQQAREEVQDARIFVGKKSAFAEGCDGAQRAGLKTLGFEAEQLPYVAYKQLAQTLRGKTRLKSQVAGELELQARRAGAEKMSFDTIVAAGARSALPHGRASAQAIPAQGFIILDYGVILAGYCSDMTRTVHAGSVSRAHRRMYEVVREAQLASIAAVHPGAQTGEVDHAGREVLKKAGLDTYFTHSTGHGVGIEVHEPPRLARGQTQKLMPGMVVTIEPGIYIPDEGGVRIEDMVLVTETGHEVLTPTTKDLITL
jgi:Xaa-Pro aminopeptidase